MPAVDSHSGYTPPDALVTTTTGTIGIPTSTIRSANDIVKERRLVDFGIRLYYSFYDNYTSYYWIYFGNFNDIIQYGENKRRS